MSEYQSPLGDLLGIKIDGFQVQRLESGLLITTGVEASTPSAHDGIGAESKGSELDYQIYSVGRARQFLYDTAKATAEYAKDEGVTAIAYADRSARPMWVGIKEYWESTYDEPAPEMFFVNPEGFAENFMNKNAFDVLLGGYKRRMQQSFTEDHPYLAKHKKSPVLIMDNCIHGGDTLGVLQLGFNAAGFTDTRVGVLNDRDNYSGAEPDFVASPTIPGTGCTPFPVENSITKGYGEKLHSEASAAGDPHLIRQVRRELRQVIQEFKAGGEGYIPPDVSSSPALSQIDRAMAAAFLKDVLGFELSERGIFF